MAYSSLVGIDRTPGTAPGHDSDLLGPSDSSDSGSDVAGIAQPDDGGFDAPVDKATAGDIERPGTSIETVGPGVDSDASGTGERRSAGGDAGLREAADISPDRIVDDPDASDSVDDDASIDLAALGTDVTSMDDADEDDDEEEEDEDADPVGDPNAPPVEPLRTGDVDDEGDDLVLTRPR